MSKSIRLPEVGDIIDERYTLGPKLGQGGMGAVHAGKHTKLGKEIAVKLLRPEYSLDENFRKRFQREALVMSKLNHPGAVSILDFGMSQGCLYLIMEMLKGEPLRKVLQRHIGGLPMDRVLHYSTELASVLIATHAHDIVHRDLKPDNIMIEPMPGGSERLVVLDFGLAFIDQDEDMGRMTQVGLTAGTPQYISPEQATGEPVTPSADIYASGCLIYELITGTPPFFDTTVLGMLNKHVYKTPKPPRQRASRNDIPPLLEHLVMAMLRKEPEERPTAQRVVKALIDMQRGGVGLAQSDGLRGRISVPERAQRMITPPPGAVGQAKARGGHNAMVLGIMGDCDDDELIDTLAVQGVMSIDLDHLQNPPDAIFAPGASAQAVKTLTARQRPIISTSKPTDIDRISALLRAGAAEVIPLPIHPTQAAQKIIRAVRKARRRQKRG